MNDEETVRIARIDLAAMREMIRTADSIMGQAEVLLMVGREIVRASGYKGMDAERWIAEVTELLGEPE